MGSSQAPSVKAGEHALGNSAALHPAVAELPIVGNTKKRTLFSATIVAHTNLGSNRGRPFEPTGTGPG